MIGVTASWKPICFGRGLAGARQCRATSQATQRCQSAETCQQRCSLPGLRVIMRTSLLASARPCQAQHGKSTTARRAPDRPLHSAYGRPSSRIDVACANSVRRLPSISPNTTADGDSRPPRCGISCARFAPHGEAQRPVRGRMPSTLAPCRTARQFPWTDAPGVPFWPNSSVTAKHPDPCRAGLPSQVVRDGPEGASGRRI